MKCSKCGQDMVQWHDQESRLFCNNPDCEMYKKIMAKRLAEVLNTRKENA